MENHIGYYDKKKFVTLSVVKRSGFHRYFDFEDFTKSVAGALNKFIPQDVVIKRKEPDGYYMLISITLILVSAIIYQSLKLMGII